MKEITPNLGRQYDVTESQVRNGQEIDIKNLDDHTIIFYLQESVIKADIANEIVNRILSEAEQRGLIETSEWLK